MSIDERMMERANIAIQLKEMRNQAGLNQRDLADKLGRSQRWISLIERFERDISAIDLHKWLEECGQGGKQIITPKTERSPDPEWDEFTAKLSAFWPIPKKLQGGILALLEVCGREPFMMTGKPNTEIEAAQAPLQLSDES